jgi:competence protein ComEA
LSVPIRGFAVPENDSTRVPGAPAPALDERRAALAAPPGSLWLARAESVADAMGTTVVRLGAGALVGALVVAAVAWTLLAGPGAHASGRVDDGALPRAPARAAPPSTSDGPAEVVVDAAGAVVRPGVYRLGSAVRVSDVLAAAGGPAPDADLDQVNLAAQVSDGQWVYVPRKGEHPPAALTGGPAPPGSAGAPTQPVNLNSATAEELDALPGVGPATARAIVAWREQHGRFARVDDLLKVRGIGPAKLDALRSEVRV